MTTRFQEITDWTQSLITKIDPNCINYIQADASNRKYLRVTAPSKSFIIMDTVPDQALENFLKLTAILAGHHIKVPDIIHANVAQGLLLMNDLGQQTYLAVLQKAEFEQARELYTAALATLINIQQISTDPNVLRYNLVNMNQDYIDNRLQVFTEWYLGKHLGLELDHKFDNMMHELQQLFYGVFAELTTVFVHVDYHSRNLMFTPSGPGVLDYQDAMSGPATYDLVSLFQDAYITWPRAQVEQWVEEYRLAAIDAGVLAPISLEALLRNFDLVGLQRHIKNLGIFARLHHRDNKSNYLNDIPTLLHYITTTIERYPELAQLGEFMAKTKEVAAQV